MRATHSGVVNDPGSNRAWTSSPTGGCGRPDAEVAGNMLRTWGLTRLGCDLVGRRVFPFLTEPNVIVAANDAAVYVAIEGTDPLNIATVISNLNARDSGSGTHSGFQAMANALRPGSRHASGARSSSRAAVVWSAGHSLGGAIAVLIAKELAESRLAVTTVYTFGAPRSGAERFMVDYNSLLGDRTYRLVFGKDVVPLVPTAPYRHVGRYAYAASRRFVKS